MGANRNGNDDPRRQTTRVENVLLPFLICLTYAQHTLHSTVSKRGGYSS